jgi:hypothetical protein
MDLPTVAYDQESACGFIKWCVARIGLAYHPDTHFRDYLDHHQQALFLPEEVAVLEALASAAFDVLGDEVYTLGLNEFERLSHAD